MSEVVERLGIGARHVIFGHTHRAGMLEGDEPAEWLTPNGARLHNAGSWVFSRAFSSDPAEPLLAGRRGLVEDGAPPAPPSPARRPATPRWRCALSAPGPGVKQTAVAAHARAELERQLRRRCGARARPAGTRRGARPRSRVRCALTAPGCAGRARPTPRPPHRARRTARLEAILGGHDEARARRRPRAAAARAARARCPSSSPIARSHSA